VFGLSDIVGITTLSSQTNCTDVVTGLVSASPVSVLVVVADGNVSIGVELVAVDDLTTTGAVWVILDMASGPVIFFLTVNPYFVFGVSATCWSTPLDSFKKSSIS
jgi:hypothetical protein